LRHLIEGEKIAKKILQSINYEKERIREITWIVRNHEDAFAFPPSDSENINLIIVSDADKLFRITPTNFSDIVNIHKASPKEAIEYLMDMKDKWLITRTARSIAEEEIRKIPGAYLFSRLFE